MAQLALVQRGKKGPRRFGWLLCVLALPLASCTAVRYGKLPAVPKWTRFEQAFESRVAYSNALQQATLTVVFSSPLGETNPVYGFWDGGTTWRVRFSPNQAGRWSYETICSDPANPGLHHRTGAFLCTAPAGANRFQRHGPVRAARDHRHFEHADGTPFFWLADCAWAAALLSDPEGWQRYCATRAGQKFTAVQWSAANGMDLRKEYAFSGSDRIAVNPAFFQRLDAKVDALNRAGLLSVIMPFYDIRMLPGDPKDAEGVLYLRYLAARWGANDVAWLLPVDAGELEPCKRLGRAVFGEGPHAPVLIDSRVDEFAQFRDEKWVDAFGYMSDFSEKSLADFLSGPFVTAWQKEPVHPLLNLFPIYEDGRVHAGKPFGDANEVRRAAWLSLLLAPPAGVGYGTLDVATWSSTTNLPPNHPADEAPPWQEAASLPGAKQMTILATFVNSIEFWRLVPSPQIVAVQPGLTSPRRYIAVAATETKDLTIVYVPEDRTLDLFRNALPRSPVMGWTNPRTGETEPAVAVVEGGACRFPTPGPGDWLLVIKAGK